MTVAVRINGEVVWVRVSTLELVRKVRARYEIRKNKIFVVDGR